MSNTHDSDRFHFTNDWFETNTRATWDHLMPQLKPRRILEIGSFEGASACYLIMQLAANDPIELHCIDNWQGGLEHQPGGNAASDMQQVEARFAHNTRLAIGNARHKVDLAIHKGNSDDCMVQMIATGMSGSFDFVFVDGSHQAPDVLSDAVLGFKLLKIGGVLGFDDYLWGEMLPYGSDPICRPKMAIDAFTNIYCRKLNLLRGSNYQFYVQKVAA